MMQINRLWRLALGVVCLSISLAAMAVDPFAQSSLLGGSQKKPRFLNVEQAFSVAVEQQAHALKLSFRVTPEHYLYQDRFALTAQSPAVTVGKISFDRTPTFEEDPDFGRVPVFDQDVVLMVPVDGSGSVKLRWQGCAKAGLCYPPQTQVFDVYTQTTSQTSTTPITADHRTQLERSAGVQSVRIPMPIPRLSIEQQLGKSLQPISLPVPEWMIEEAEAEAEAAEMPATQAALDSQDEQTAATDDPFGLASHPWTALGLLFLAGLGLAFTPCVLPMLPIVANLVARQHRRSAQHGLWLSGNYALGVASSYAMLGALIALFGHQLNLVGLMQQPAILLAVAALFVVLALMSADVVVLRLPHVIKQQVDRLGQVGQHERLAGSSIGCFLAGFFSALVVSPCVSAPLAGVLLSVSTVGDPLLGAAALFMLGLGLSMPLVLLGATEGRLLPQAGDWLHWVRQGFALLLLAVALLLINRVFDTSWMLLIWAMLLMMLSVWLWRWSGRGRLITQALAAVLAMWSATQVVGAAQGQTDPWQPLAVSSESAVAEVSTQKIDIITTLAQLDTAKQQHANLMVDVTADWCMSCKVMEKNLFGSNTPAQMQGWTRIKLDVTDTNANSQAALAQLQLFGPPALLFYQQGHLVKTLVGEVERPELVRALESYPKIDR